MATRTLSVYPAGLPGPSIATVSPAERRLLSDLPGVQQVRGIQRDYMAFQDLEWSLLDADAALIWNTWWRDTITYGMAWFLATWPSPIGWTAIERRFLGPPRWEHLPNGFWRVAVRCELRGRGVDQYLIVSDCMLAGTAAEIAKAEPEGVFLWRISDPSPLAIAAYETSHGPLVGTYQSLGRDPGAVGPSSSFPIAFVVDWADLASPGVSVFSGTRNSNFPGSTQPVSISVTGGPDDASVAECRACVFQTVGTWSGSGLDGNPRGFWASSTVPVTLPGGAVMHASFYPDQLGGGGSGTSQATFLLRALHGVVVGMAV